MTSSWLAWKVDVGGSGRFGLGWRKWLEEWLEQGLEVFQRLGEVSPIIIKYSMKDITFEAQKSLYQIKVTHRNEFLTHILQSKNQSQQTQKWTKQLLTQYSHHCKLTQHLQTKNHSFLQPPPLHYKFFLKPEWMKLFKMNTYSSAPSQSIIDVSVVNQHFN